MAERIVAMHAAYASGKATIDGFLARPRSGTPRAAIVLVHGYRGLDDGQRAVTRRFAQEGFVCLSPDLFHGRTYHTLADCAFAKTSLDIARAVSQIQDAAPYLRKLRWVDKKPIAVLGFCMGGGLALYAVAGSRAFAAGVIYYQSLFPDPEDLKGISAPLLCHYGTEDHGTTQTEIDMFRAALDRHRKKYQIEMYPGAGHAFLNNPQSENSANRRAAERSVSLSSKWLKRILG